MRNLWNFIIQYHVILLFCVLQFFALSWYVTRNGYPRGKWVKRTLEWQGSWNEQITKWTRLNELAELNQELLAENASLRAELFAANQRSPSVIQSAEVVRFTWSNNANYFIINQGIEEGVAVGQGVSHEGIALGRIAEVSDHYALGVPIINGEVEWSVRVGMDGPVGRLSWDGTDITIASLHDIPKSTDFSPGDSIFTSGFQGFFPKGMLIGRVDDSEPYFDGQFLQIPIVLAGDFRSMNYVKVLIGNELEQYQSLIPNSDSSRQ